MHELTSKYSNLRKLTIACIYYFNDVIIRQANCLIIFLQCVACYGFACTFHNVLLTISQILLFFTVFLQVHFVMLLSPSFFDYYYIILLLYYYNIIIFTLWDN